MKLISVVVVVFFLPLGCSGKIVFYTHPPEQHSLPTHLSADIVSEWSKEFDLVSFHTVQSQAVGQLMISTRTTPSEC